MPYEWFMAFDHLPEGTDGRSWAVGDGALSDVNLQSESAIVTVSGRRILRLRGGNAEWTKLFTASNPVTFGARYRAGSLGGEGRVLLELRNAGGGVCLNLFHNNDDTIAVRRGTSVLATSSASIAASATAYIEFFAYIHSTEGVFELRIDGVTVASGVDVNTQNVAGPVVRISAQSPTGSNARQTWWTDLYIRERSDPESPGFWGPIALQWLAPDSDEQAEWAPDSGTDNFARVADTASGADGDTSYVESDTLDDEDQYGLADLPAEVNSIIAVVPFAVARAPAGGAPQIGLGLKRDAAEVLGAELTPGADFGTMLPAPFMVQPNSSAWSIAAVNELVLRMRAV